MSAGPQCQYSAPMARSEAPDIAKLTVGDKVRLSYSLLEYTVSAIHGGIVADLVYGPDRWPMSRQPIADLILVARGGQ